MRIWVIALSSLLLALVLWEVYRPYEATSESVREGFPGEAVAIPEFTQVDTMLEGSTSPDPSVERSATVEDSDQLAEWPVAPETLEQIMISALLGSADLENIVIESAECSLTECEIRVSSSNEDRSYYPAFRETFNEFPIPRNMSMPLEVELADRDSAEPDIIRMSIEVRPLRDPTLFDLPAERLHEIVESRSVIDDFPVPTELFPFQSADGSIARVMVESVCETDCAFGSKQIIYIDVPDGQTCTQLKGVDQFILVGTELGGLVERTFCVPNTLIQE
jgi:hypothetical protein